MSATVKAYVMKTFGMTEKEYDEMVNAMRIINDFDAFCFANDGIVTPTIQARMLPMPTPKQIYKEARSWWRSLMREIDRADFGYYY